jgi:hypothetical protein
MTERQGIALRQPGACIRSRWVSSWSRPLLSRSGCTPGSCGEDGVDELLQAHAIAWTKRAVRVRFGAPPHQHEVWVWAGAVERA